jgi:hypothetical protein
MKLPPPNSRVAFVGPTRSGKTYLARSWLQHYDNVAVLDPKGQFDWKQPASNERFSRVAKTWRKFTQYMERSAKDGWPVIYRPPAEHLLPHNSHELDRFYWYCLQRGNTLTYTDELYYVAHGSDFAKRAPWFFRCVTAGASKGVGTWTAFQRPSWVPLIALTETELRAIFNLRVSSDRDRIEESFGEVPWDVLRRERHSFVLSTDEWTSSVMRLAPPPGTTAEGVQTLGSSSRSRTVPLGGGASP